LLADAPEFVSAGAPFFWNERRMEVAVSDGRWKAIWNRSANTFVLFDLEQDRGEQRDLAVAQPAELARLRDWLRAELERGR
jgi:arylsulfatase A-like enzyme